MKQCVYQHSCYCWYSCHFYCYIHGVAIVVVVVVPVVSVVSQPPVRMT